MIDGERKEPAARTAGCGYAAIIAVFAAMPGTTKALATKTKFPLDYVKKLLAGLRSVGLVGYDQIVVNTKWTRVYSVRESERSGIRPPVRMVYFASLWRAVKEHGPLTLEEISEETGLHVRQLQDLTRMLREARLMYRASWRLHRFTWAAQYRVGRQPDAKQPKTPRKEINAKAWSARKVRNEQMTILHALAGIRPPDSGRNDREGRR